MLLTVLFVSRGITSLHSRWSLAQNNPNERCRSDGSERSIEKNNGREREREKSESERESKRTMEKGKK